MMVCASAASCDKFIQTLYYLSIWAIRGPVFQVFRLGKIQNEIMHVEFAAAFCSTMTLRIVRLF